MLKISFIKLEPMSFYSIFIIALLSFYTACKPRTSNLNNNEQIVLPSKIQILYDTVGAKHDTAMLMMKDIGKCQYALRNYLQAANVDTTKKENILTALSNLKKGEEAMMAWMREFKGLELEEEYYKKNSNDSIMHYLKAEEVKIEKVHNLMLKNIESAKELLKICVH